MKKLKNAKPSSSVEDFVEDPGIMEEPGLEDIPEEAVQAYAEIGAEAEPPIFAKEATPQVNMSSLKILARRTMIIPWMARIIKPAMIQIGASVNSKKLAREASNATTEYSNTLESSEAPAINIRIINK